MLNTLGHQGRRARTSAYFNPQNLNIGSLISSPRASPFAKALGSAQLVLVCPNGRTSIYARLWCCYEAFLAFSWDTPIRTAVKNDEVWCLIPRLLCVCVSSAGVMVLVLFQGGGTWLRRGGAAAFLVPMTIFGLLVISRVQCIPEWARQASGGLFAVCLSMFISMSALFWPPSTSALFMPGALCLIFLLEVERIQASDAAKRINLLNHGYSGLLNAGCSSEADKASIHAEILQSGMLEQVEHAVQVLLSTNASTSEIRRTVELTGMLGDVTRYGWLATGLGLMIWCLLPIEYVRNPESSAAQRLLAALSLTQGCLWLLLVGFSSPFRRAFATRLQLFHLIVGFYPALSALTGVDRLLEGPPFITALLVGPFILITSMAGPLRVARVPLVGVLLVQLCLGRWSCFSRCHPGSAWQVPCERVPEATCHCKAKSANLPEPDFYGFHAGV